MILRLRNISFDVISDIKHCQINAICTDRLWKFEIVATIFCSKFRMKIMKISKGYILGSSHGKWLFSQTLIVLSQYGCVLYVFELRKWFWRTTDCMFCKLHKKAFLCSKKWNFGQFFAYLVGICFKKSKNRLKCFVTLCKRANTSKVSPNLRDCTQTSYNVW